MTHRRPLCLFLVVLTGLTAMAVPQSSLQKSSTKFPTNSPVIPPALFAQVAGKPWQNPERGPVSGLKEFAREKSGAVWLGCDKGAARFDPSTTNQWDRWQYFFGPRWLPDNEVLNIQIEEAGPGRKVWVRAKSG